MSPLDITLAVPLTLNEDGTIRIAGSRVTLDSVIHLFKQGATAEQILDCFPSLTLREIYGAITYYLDQTEVVENYLDEQEKEAEATRRFIESRLDTAVLRELIRARRRPDQI